MYERACPSSISDTLNGTYYIRMRASMAAPSWQLTDCAQTLPYHSILSPHREHPPTVLPSYHLAHTGTPIGFQ